MKKLLLTICLAAGLVAGVKANLGNTYNECLQHWGPEPGKYDDQTNSYEWFIPEDEGNTTRVIEYFTTGKSSATVFVFSYKNGITEGALWQFLAASTPGQEWIEYNEKLPGKRGFITIDKTVYGTTWKTKSGKTVLRIAYWKYLVQTGALEQP